MRLLITNTYQKIVVFVSIVCLLALAATAIFVFTYTPDKSQRNIYRDDMLDTYLGSLPQPVKIFENKQNEFIAVTEDGERIPLNKIPAINRNEDSEVYFDKYDDRVFYHQDHHLKVYDVQTESTRSLPYRGGSMKDHKIAGVYKNRFLTQLKGGQAGTAKFTPYNLEDNELADTDYDADRMSSNLTTVTAFTINERRHYLYTDARKKHEHAASDTLSIYLDRKDASRNADPLSSQGRGGITPAMDLIFSRGSGAGRAELDARAELLLQIPSKTDIPFGYTSWRPFRVRGAYALEDQRVAIAVDDGLVVVDVGEEKATPIENGQRVQRMLKNAALIAPPVGNNFTPHNESYCFINEHSDPTIEDADFVFCLE